MHEQHETICHSSWENLFNRLAIPASLLKGDLPQCRCYEHHPVSLSDIFLTGTFAPFLEKSLVAWTLALCILCLVEVFQCSTLLWMAPTLYYGQYVHLLSSFAWNTDGRFGNMSIIVSLWWFMTCGSYFWSSATDFIIWWHIDHLYIFLLVLVR